MQANNHKASKQNARNKMQESMPANISNKQNANKQTKCKQATNIMQANK